MMREELKLKVYSWIVRWNGRSRARSPMRREEAEKALQVVWTFLGALRVPLLLQEQRKKKRVEREVSG